MNFGGMEGVFVAYPPRPPRMPATVPGGGHSAFTLRVPALPVYER